jgi:hypothetical protein
MRFAYGSLFVVAAFTACSTEIIDETTGASSSSSSSSSSSTGMGGSGNSGGEGGGFGGTGGTIVSPLPECVYDADCTLINDCCSCEGISKNETLPDCPLMGCFAPTCESIGMSIPTAVCRASHCVVNADCNQAHAQCDSIPPMCGPGTTPLVVNGCWGGCIDITECSEVGSCTQCAADQACVNSNTMMMPGLHCVDVPNSCNGQISCACMGENVCGFAQGCVELGPTELKCVDIITK